MELFVSLFFCVLVIGIIIFLIYKLLEYNKYNTFIKENSVAIKELKLLNDKFKNCFHEIPEYNLKHEYDNETFYSLVSCEDYLIYELQYNYKNVFNIINCTIDNIKNNNSYLEIINQLKCKIGIYNIDLDKFNLDELKRIEVKNFNSFIINPKTNFNISVTLIRTNINGDFKEAKEQIFSIAQIKTLISKVTNKSSYYFNDKEIWDSICRVERAKVSNKMHFSIYKRDNYRCCYCGKKDTGDNLEIDHIKPIAAGGKSVYNNLQTLCRKCNKEKGAKY